MTSNYAQPARNQAIDLMKLIASFFVVCIHTKTLSSVDHFEPGSFSFIIDSIARFAVPFFFISSGYLTDFSNRVRAIKKLRNIIILYIFWSVIFILIRQAYSFDYPAFTFTNNEKYRGIFNEVYKWLFYGQERHLWYFPAYIVGVLIMLFLYKNTKLLVPIAIILYILGLTGQTIRSIYPEYMPSIPMSSYPYEWLQKTYLTRNGIFLAFPCMAAGYIIRQYKNKIANINNLLLVMVTAVLFGLQYVECNNMHIKYGTVADYYFSTLPLSGLLLLLAIKHADIHLKLTNTGKLATGIYVLHPVFMYMVFAYGTTLTQLNAWPYIYTPLLIIISWLATLLLQRIPLIRKAVMY